ncbi:MAG TPA: hypothetical protein VEP30_05120 [Chthoniobacterales bacterium]|nr:hypothetical protein [Chthoniobacterales bacterium]
MSGAASLLQPEKGADGGAPAPPPRLPSLKKDNCIVNGRYRSVFVAQENIRLYIWKYGEQNVGALTVTAADCLETSEFQDKWHSYLNALKKIFPTGMWTRERQPRSGNWHAHAAVNIGWDLKTNFPREQVERRFYANVDPRLRELWRYLRDKAGSHGFGRVELLPLKYSGDACARYFTKYLTKALGSEKASGEEKCRLFSVWGGVRFVHSRFTFLSSRIIQKRKQWLAEELEYSDPSELKKLSPHWWFHFGKALCEVIMPEDFYKIGPPGNRQFDELGLRTLQRDWATWQGEPSDDLMRRSQFNLFYDIGIRLFGRKSRQALDFAMYIMATRERVLVAPYEERN